MLKKFLKILFVPIFLTSLNVSLCPAIAVNYGFQDDSQSKAIKIRTINISSLGRVGISNAIDELHKEFGSDKDIEKNTAKGILGEIVAIALYEKMVITLSKIRHIDLLDVKSQANMEKPALMVYL